MRCRRPGPPGTQRPNRSTCTVGPITRMDGIPAPGPAPGKERKVDALSSPTRACRRSPASPIARSGGGAHGRRSRRRRTLSYTETWGPRQDWRSSPAGCRGLRRSGSATGSRRRRKRASGEGRDGSGLGRVTSTAKRRGRECRGGSGRERGATGAAAFGRAVLGLSGTGRAPHDVASRASCRGFARPALGAGASAASLARAALLAPVKPPERSPHPIRQDGIAPCGLTCGTARPPCGAHRTCATARALGFSSFPNRRDSMKAQGTGVRVSPPPSGGAVA